MLNQDEILFVVDANNKPVTPLLRPVVHKKGYWHRTCHIWIVNSKDEILCQQRSLEKDTNPGKWEPSFGAHLAPHDNYDDTAIAKLREELGLRVTKSDLKQYGVFKSGLCHEFEALFVLQWEGIIANLEFEKEEIRELRLFTVEALERFIVKEKSKNWTRFGYEEEMFSYLKGLI